MHSPSATTTVSLAVEEKLQQQQQQHPRRHIQEYPLEEVVTVAVKILRVIRLATLAVAASRLLRLTFADRGALHT
jgi:hypothetical protein